MAGKSPVTVRLASEADIEAVVTLNAVVQSLHATLHPEIFKSVADRAGARAIFAARLASPENRIALADVDGAPVGYVFFEAQTLAETSFCHARRRLYVHHLCVVEAMRRQGVATALLRLVERQAAADGVAEIALDVWAANEEAIQFFESIGFAQYNIALKKLIY
jgi:ribosomal protein S18 acetylase RimI-like enzyme